MYNAILYGIAAVLIIIINPKKVLYGKKEKSLLYGNPTVM